jgi:hypothetical protein
MHRTPVLIAGTGKIYGTVTCRQFQKAKFIKGFLSLTLKGGGVIVKNHWQYSNENLIILVTIKRLPG